MSGSQTFKNNSRRVQGGNWRRVRKCVGKCRWCDCRNPRSPNCDKTCQDQQGVLKPTYIPFRSRKILLTQTNTSAPPAPDGEMKEPECKEVSVATSALQQVSTKTMLLNVSGFRKARVNGTHREGNVCSRSVF